MWRFWKSFFDHVMIGSVEIGFYAGFMAFCTFGVTSFAVYAAESIPIIL